MLRNEYLITGQRLPRLDGAAKASGRHVYGADFALPGMLYGKVLRSEVPHARLVRIDTSRAAALPGVRAVITWADIPQALYGNAVKDLTVFATDRVRFVGHPLAAVAATTPEVAEGALALIDVELEPLEAVYDPDRALGYDAPLLHPDWHSYQVLPFVGGGFGGKLRIGVEHFAALLARVCGRPVKIITTSEEELIAAHPRQSSIITLKTGVSREGRILAREGRVIVDCGAYAGSGPLVGAVALQVLAGPYRTPNLCFESLAVYTNKVPTGSFRAPSGPMANLAVECQMDMIAEDL